MKKASRENNRTTLPSNCKNTANTYKSTISQDNKSPRKIQTNTRKKWHGNKVKFNTVDFVELAALLNVQRCCRFKKVDRVEFNFVASVYRAL